MVDRDDEVSGPKLSDLTRDGAVGAFIDRETDALKRQVEAYREAAVDREVRLRARDEAEQDIAAEADRRAGRRGLRAV